MLREGFLAFMQDLTGLGIGNHLVIQVVLSVNDSAQMHQLPCLPVQVGALDLLDERLTPTGVTTFHPEFLVECNRIVDGDVECSRGRAAGRASGTVLGRLVGVFL